MTLKITYKPSNWNNFPPGTYVRFDNSDEHADFYEIFIYGTVIGITARYNTDYNIHILYLAVSCIRESSNDETTLVTYYIEPRDLEKL